MVKKITFILITFCIILIAGCKKGYPPYILNGFGSSFEINATLSNSAKIKTIINPNNGFKMGFEKGLFLQEVTIKTNGIFIIHLSKKDLDLKRKRNNHEIWLFDKKGIHSLSKKELAQWIKNTNQL